jgi:predicted nucleic acid-binding protein
MSDNIHLLKDCRPYEGENFFFDANIWMFVYGPVTVKNEWHVNTYSTFMAKLQMRKCNIYTNSLIISEFVNRFARMGFDQKREELDYELDEFKDFRNSGDFEPFAFEIAANIRKIVHNSKICYHQTSSDALLDSADIYQTGNVDFNDMIYVDVCKENNFVLVTDDVDFKDFEIAIVTANKRLAK